MSDSDRVKLTLGTRQVELGLPDIQQIRAALIATIQAAEIHDDDRQALLKWIENIYYAGDSVSIGRWHLSAEDGALLLRMVPVSTAAFRVVCEVPIRGAPGAFETGPLKTTRAHRR